MELSKKIILLNLIMMQMACTSVVWNGGIYDADRAIDTQTIITQIAHDQIHALGRMPIQPNQPLSGSLVMMGKKYWYVIQSDTAQQIAAPLMKNLPKRYQMTAPYSGAKLDALPVTIIDGNHFYSEFCLDYLAENHQQNQILTQLKFQQQANPQHYRQCYAATGTIYMKPHYFKEDYRFHEYIPIKLTLKQKTTNIQTNKLVRNLLLTPLALAMDAMSGMVMLPVLLIGDLFD